MDRRYKWINEMVRLGNIKFEFTPTTEQKADGLTKPMIGKQFLTARNYLSMAIRNRRRLIRRKRGCHGWKRI
jgi:hypothetical protein